MRTDTKYKTIAIILLFLLLFSYSVSHSLKKDNALLRDKIEDYQSALGEANNNIEEANSIIEEAQSYAWSSYDDMGDVLDNLTTFYTVDEPY